MPRPYERTVDRMLTICKLALPNRGLSQRAKLLSLTLFLLKLLAFGRDPTRVGGQCHYPTIGG